MAAVGEERLATGHRLENAGLVLFSQRALVDPPHFRHVTDEAFATVRVQVVRHKHPADLRIGSDGVVNVPTDILLSPGNLMACRVLQELPPVEWFFIFSVAALRECHSSRKQGTTRPLSAYCTKLARRLQCDFVRIAYCRRIGTFCWEYTLLTTWLSPEVAFA